MLRLMMKMALLSFGEQLELILQIFDARRLDRGSNEQQRPEREREVHLHRLPMGDWLMVTGRRERLRMSCLAF